MNVRDTVLAALRRDPALLKNVGASVRRKLDPEAGRLGTVVQAAEALEPVLQDAFRKRPTRLTRLGLKSAQIVAGLAAEDAQSNRRLAAIAAGRTVGIVFVDVAGFTLLTEELGDERAIELLSRLSAIVESRARSQRGEVVKSLGDGFLLAFPSAGRAVRGALAVRDAITKEREGDPTFDIHVRISVHAGEPLVQGDDLLGHDVNLAARLLDHCLKDKILISEAAKELAERRLKNVEFGRRRTAKIRGLATKVAVYPVKGVSAPEVRTRATTRSL